MIMTKGGLMRLAARWVLAITLLLGLAAGCAGGDNPGGGSVQTGLESFDAVCDGADLYQVEPPSTVLPKDAVLVSVERCVTQSQRVPGDGEWQVQVRQEAQADLGALADALRLPTEKPGARQICPAMLYAPIIIKVTDSTGRTLVPAVPHDACNAPLSAVTNALDALGWRDLETVMVGQILTELSFTSGCSDAYKPLEVLTDGSGTRQVTLNPAPLTLRVCRYDLDPDPDHGGVGLDGTVYLAGALTSADTIDPAGGEELLTAIAAAPQAETCTEPQSPFAVLHQPDGSAPWITIELAGCHRVLLDGENYLRQLDGALVDRLVNA